MLHLTDTCDFLARGVRKQAYGAKPTHDTYLATAVPCRLIEKTQRGFNSITAQWLTTTTYKLMLPYETEILEGDRVTNIRLYGNQASDRDALLQQHFEVEGGALAKRGALVRHKTVSLKKVS